MIDRNLYEEFQKLRKVADQDVPVATEEGTPESRLVENVLAATELSEEERNRRHQELMDYINSSEAQEFYKLLRRNESNPFNALFYDKEKLTEESISERVKKASRFFGLPIPTMIDSCESLASVTFSDSGKRSEIKYEVIKLEEIGINNVDAFDALITHELSHVLLKDMVYNYCENLRWSNELACDFIAGARCSVDRIATGKYKYAVSIMNESLTHPGGEMRIKAVQAGYEFAEWLFEQGIRATLNQIMHGINQFLCINSKELNESYRNYLNSQTESDGQIDVMVLPDDNLLKQKIIQHINETNT